MRCDLSCACGASHSGGSGEGAHGEHAEASNPSALKVRRRVRLTAVLSVGLGSVVIGLLLVWFLVNPQMIAAVTTWELAGALGLLVLPVAAVVAWQHDRGVRADLPASQVAEAARIEPNSRPAETHAASAPALRGRAPRRVRHPGARAPGVGAS